MSKGSTQYVVRFPAEIEAAMHQCIRDRNDVTANEPWSVASFVRKAVEEKLKHMARSRRPGRRRKA